MVKKFVILILCLAIVLCSCVYCFADDDFSGMKTFCLVKFADINMFYTAKFSVPVFLKGLVRPANTNVSVNNNGSYIMGLSGNFSTASDIVEYLNSITNTSSIPTYSVSDISYFYFSEDVPSAPEPTQPTFWDRLSDANSTFVNILGSVASGITSNPVLLIICLMPLIAFVFILLKRLL